MKNLIFTLLLLFSFNLFAQTKVEFYYAAESTIVQHLEFEGWVNKYDRQSQTYYQEWQEVVADVELHFIPESTQTGIGTFFRVDLENGKLSINEISGRNIIALGTVDKFERIENDGEARITLKMNIQFKNATTDNIFAPVQNKISSITEDDHFLNIITEKIPDPNFFKLILKVSKKKFLSSKTLIDRRILPEEMDISPYGDHQSLITIDLEFLLDYLEPGDKFRVEVETRMDMGNMNILSKKFAGLEKLIQYKKETLKL